MLAKPFYLDQSENLLFGKYSIGVFLRGFQGRHSLVKAYFKVQKPLSPSEGETTPNGHVGSIFTKRF